MAESEIAMREMIVNELTQTMHELARDFAHYLPRLIEVAIVILSGLLLAAMAAFGVITYTKPLRLWHERKIESDLNRGLPKIP